MSSMKVLEGSYSGLRCAPCGKSLQPCAVELEYMGSRFNVELPACPSCGAVFIPEELAMGKMAQVEHLLEDK
ncbi:DVU_1557 family redox protein [Nitratidesulfovibrio vulgaris]|uniref:DUF7479 domain-containing protein n=1 Tax=Nitratidesulfovibrio vulgaris (strain ATCC 29579 / DSM 644 / CCUG 34227 / NCIMB 8303 / VKM B-1760 / Hildenborough) TaxID=882 RepID=Q72BS7_NITV2|nr:CLJU_RS11820 family redox protein [Nitratidesulfovibrio vulgaris]AAS96035.1 hypothetical protein DVU_1557 [Nitratidesulfovibrio vulgaris str. Hildenborough]ADP86888.1 hypothetical protein Deval_1737 [Nitratidesulfovibrio vulgaris RCH1]